MLIEVREAVFGYGKRSVIAVNELSLEEGQALGIFGPNGSGKTTLVRGVSGLMQQRTASESLSRPSDCLRSAA